MTNPRNLGRRPRVAGLVMGPGWLAGAAALGLGLLLVSGGAPASAHARVFVGGVFGYPPPYAYGPWVYPAPYPWAAYPEVPPPGWAPGHWEWRYDQWGRRYQAWIPAHLE